MNFLRRASIALITGILGLTLLGAAPAEAGRDTSWPKVARDTSWP